MMNTEPSLKPNPKLRWYQPKICTYQKGTHGIRTRDLATGATGALSIELIPSFHRANLPGFDTYTSPIGGVLFRSTTDDMNDVKVIRPRNRGAKAEAKGDTGAGSGLWSAEDVACPRQWATRRPCP
jgi:hypothetical protein